MHSLLILVVAWGCISMTSAYQCYSCGSGTDGCGETFNSAGKNFSKANAPDKGACSITREETKGGTRVARGAVSDIVDCIGGTSGCSSYTEKGITTRICCCQSELCNNVPAVRQQPFTILFVTMGTFAMFIYRWF